MRDGTFRMRILRDWLASECFICFLSLKAKPNKGSRAGERREQQNWAEDIKECSIEVFGYLDMYIYDLRKLLWTSDPGKGWASLAVPWPTPALGWGRRWRGWRGRTGKFCWRETGRVRRRLSQPRDLWWTPSQTSLSVRSVIRLASSEHQILK